MLEMDSGIYRPRPLHRVKNCLIVELAFVK